MNHSATRSRNVSTRRSGAASRPADPGLDADARALHDVMVELKRVYQFLDRGCVCCYDVSVTQCWALEALRRRGSLTLGELAAELYLDKSTASRVVSTLERKGYVRRRPHPRDGRALRLELTRAGGRLYERIEADMLEEEKRALVGFAPEVRGSLVELLGRLVQAALAGVVAGKGDVAGCGVVGPENDPTDGER